MDEFFSEMQRLRDAVEEKQILQHVFDRRLEHADLFDGCS
jgi:hypothetical protein